MLLYMLLYFNLCYRYGLSNTEAAAVANAALEDYGVITADNRADVIAPSKIASERRRHRRRRREDEMASMDNVTSIYFDGKKTATRTTQHNAKTGNYVL